MTFQAITTKYIGPTNVRGSRVKALSAAKNITLHWDYALNPDDNHRVAAETLAEKLGWEGCWYGGSLPGGNGNCYVRADNPADSAFRINAQCGLRPLVET
jgi:hypothetical protein